MIKIELIDELISKFLSGEASPEEAMLLEDWKTDLPENLRYYASSEKIFVLITSEKHAIEPNIELAWKKVEAKTDKRSKVVTQGSRFSYVWLAAASIVLLVGLGILSFLFNTPEQHEIVYTTGINKKEVMLSDGTAIAISQNSSLIVDQDFGRSNRSLHLKGGADFIVVHQETLPFIVDIGNIFVKDIGTHFSIRSSTDTIFIRVDEGSVLLYDSLGSALEIKEKENAIYIKSLKKIVTAEQMKDINETLNFSNASLEEVIAQLMIKYKATIALEHANLKKCTITTQFNKEDLETVLGVITETLGLRYEKTPSGYLIKGHSCQLQ